MRKAGYALAGLALVLAILIQVFGIDGPISLAAFGLCMSLGALALLTSGLIRLAKGELKLRPLDALKRMPILFVIFGAMLLTLHFIFDSSDQTLAESLIMVVLLTVFFAFYQTAYRMPGIEPSTSERDGPLI